MLFHKKFAHIIFPAFTNLIWQLPRAQKVLFLTFDDGPYPPVTRQVLDILERFRAPATFFLSGEMLYRYRHQLAALDYSGHHVGNHGFYHHPYFLTSEKKMSAEIRLTDTLIQNRLGETARYFRPPYGFFGPGLNRVLRQTGKDLVLWSLMSNDFKWSAERVFTYLKKNMESGDIVVFHDSAPSAETVSRLLPDFLTFCLNEGYTFRVFRS